MEAIKKTILQALTTGLTATTSGYSYVIIPDLTAVYYIKIGLKQTARDIGFFDAYVEPVKPVPPVPPTPPTPPVKTFYLVDSVGNIFTDNNNDRFIYE